MSLKYDLSLTVKKLDGSVLAIWNSNGAKDSFAEAKEVIRGKAQASADQASANAADLAQAASELT